MLSIFREIVPLKLLYISYHEVVNLFTTELFLSLLCFRHYRDSYVETPSHPGGVSDAYKDKYKNRGKHEREKGVYASSKDKPKKHKDRDRGRLYSIL